MKKPLKALSPRISDFFFPKAVGDIHLYENKEVAYTRVVKILHPSSHDLTFSLERRDNCESRRGREIFVFDSREQEVSQILIRGNAVFLL